MSLADQRRAGGAGNQAARRAIGTAITAARQSTFKQDLNSLETNSARKAGALRVKEQPGARGATRGQADYSPPASTGGGMASPLTEIGAREYHPAVLVPSSDGIFTLQIEHVKKLTMQDANEDSHEFNYLNPDA